MKTYTKEEIVKYLTDELEEELEGIKKYEEIYHSLKALGLHGEANTIEKIANDEYKHACVLWDMLKEHGADLSQHEKIQRCWGEVKNIFNI